MIAIRNNLLLQQQTTFGVSVGLPVDLDLGSALAHQIWPSAVKGGRYGSPQMLKFALNCGFWPPVADT